MLAPVALSLVAVAVLLMIGYTLQHPSGEQKYRDQCAAHLRIIGHALLAYAAEHEDVLPPHLGVLYNEYVGTLDSFVCPSTSTAVAKDVSPSNLHLDPPAYADLPSDNVDYYYLSGWTLADPPGTVVAFDALGNHGDREVHVLFLSSEVRWLEIGRLRKMITEQLDKAAGAGRRILVTRGSSASDLNWGVLGK